MFWKIAELKQVFAHCSHKSNALNLTECGLDNILGDFFSRTAVHSRVQIFTLSLSERDNPIT
jgi:hypothetical protein